MTPVPDIVCIGSVLWDIIGRTPVAMRAGADVPGRITRAPGGVAMNIAATLAGLGLRPALLTAIGRDAEGDELIAAASRLGLDCTCVWRDGGLPTDRYVAIEDRNGLIAAVADARALEAAGLAILAPLSDGQLGRSDAPWAGPIVLDGNLTDTLLTEIARSSAFSTADLRIASASPNKAVRLLPLVSHPKATFYLNLEEAGVLCGRDFATAATAAGALVALGARRALVTDGARPCADGSADGILTASPPNVQVTRVTGAGDCFMATHIVAEIAGADRETALAQALDAAARYISEGV